MEIRLNQFRAFWHNVLIKNERKCHGNILIGYQKREKKTTASKKNCQDLHQHNVIIAMGVNSLIPSSIIFVKHVSYVAFFCACASWKCLSIGCAITSHFNEWTVDCLGPSWATSSPFIISLSALFAKINYAFFFNWDLTSGDAYKSKNIQWHRKKWSIFFFITPRDRWTDTPQWKRINERDGEIVIL